MHESAWRQRQILEANTHTWMTTSDISIWLYGDDDKQSMNATRMALANLRLRSGYVTETRTATWDGMESMGKLMAHRLVRGPNGESYGMTTDDKEAVRGHANEVAA
jgi:hypothetical protein